MKVDLQPWTGNCRVAASEHASLASAAATVAGRPRSLLLQASYKRYLAPSIFTFMEAISKERAWNLSSVFPNCFLCFMYFTVSSKAP